MKAIYLVVYARAARECSLGDTEQPRGYCPVSDGNLSSGVIPVSFR